MDDFCKSHRWVNPITRRYYLINLSKDLLGDWVVTKSWGMLNSAQSVMKQQICADVDLARQLLARSTKARLKEGYRLVTV